MLVQFYYESWRKLLYCEFDKSQCLLKIVIFLAFKFYMIRNSIGDVGKTCEDPEILPVHKGFFQLIRERGSKYY